MAESYVVNALIAKYAELSGKLEACRKDAATIETYLTHLDATIRLFKEDFDAIKVRPKQQYKRNPALKKGEMVRNAYDVLRTANEPLTSREIVIRVLHRKGIYQPSEADIQNARNSVGTCLKKRLKEGIVIADNGHPKRWSLAI